MDAMRDKVYEPKPRNKDGVRFVGHRFPIKDGIDTLEVWRRLYMQWPTQWPGLFAEKKAPVP